MISLFLQKNPNNRGIEKEKNREEHETYNPNCRHKKRYRPQEKQENSTIHKKKKTAKNMKPTTLTVDTKTVSATRET
jgi:hypothetical protein